MIKKKMTHRELKCILWGLKELKLKRAEKIFDKLNLILTALKLS